LGYLFSISSFALQGPDFPAPSQDRRKVFARALFISIIQPQEATLGEEIKVGCAHPTGGPVGESVEEPSILFIYNLLMD
jgi:hypothetical protein